MRDGKQNYDDYKAVAIQPPKQKLGVYVLQLQAKVRYIQKTFRLSKAKINDGVNAMRDGKQYYDDC